jgi:uncharacterized membrane protein
MMKHITTTMLPDPMSAESVLRELNEMKIPEGAINVVAHENTNISSQGNYIALRDENIDPHSNSDHATETGVTLNMANLATFNGETVGIAGTGPVSGMLSPDQLTDATMNAHAVLTSFGISDEQMPTIEHAIAEGGVLISVLTDDESAGRVEYAFRKNHGRFIKSV